MANKTYMSLGVKQQQLHRKLSSLLMAVLKISLSNVGVIQYNPQCLNFIARLDFVSDDKDTNSSPLTETWHLATERAVIVKLQ